METSLQLTVYSYAAEMAGLADPENVRLRFDVLTKTKQPELHRYPTARDRQANVRLFRLAPEVLRGVEAGRVPPDRGVAVQGVSVPGELLGVAMSGEGSLLRMMAAAQRELTLALEERKRARRALRKADERVRAARRQLRLVLQSAKPMPGVARCDECGATLGATSHCMTCAAARAFTEP